MTIHEQRSEFFRAKYAKYGRSSDLLNSYKSFLEYTIDDILDACTSDPFIAEKALQAMIANNVLKRHIKLFEEKEIWQSIKQIRDILAHPCPQNRTESYPYFGAPQDENMIVYKDKNGEAAFEKKGLLSLTAKNNEKDAPVTKEDVVNFIKKMVDEKIKEAKESVKKTVDFTAMNMSKSILNKICSHLDKKSLHQLLLVNKKSSVFATNALNNYYIDVQPFLLFSIQNILDIYISDSFMAEKALEAMIAKDVKDVLERHVKLFKEKGVWQSIRQIRKILASPFPKNGGSKIITILLPEDENMLFCKNNNNKSNCEGESLLFLTIERDAVNFMKKMVDEKIKKVRELGKKKVDFTTLNMNKSILNKMCSYLDRKSLYQFSLANKKTSIFATHALNNIKGDYIKLIINCKPIFPYCDLEGRGLILSLTQGGLELIVNKNNTIGWLIYTIEKRFIQEQNKHAKSDREKFLLPRKEGTIFRRRKILVGDENLMNPKYLQEPITNYYKDKDTVMMTRLQSEPPPDSENPINRNKLIIEEFNRVENPSSTPQFVVNFN